MSTNQMSRQLALIANWLYAEGWAFEYEQTGGNVWVLTLPLADDSTVVVTDECVAQYAPGAWETPGSEPVRCVETYRADDLTAATIDAVRQIEVGA